jgi:protein-tyrosine phosphatase
MVDIHCHILPQVDDGSGSMEETMKMLETASREGISAMIVTPHYKTGHRNADAGTITGLMARVQEEADSRGYGIKLYPGNEIFYSDGIEELLEKGLVLGLNYTDRVLIEFSPAENYTYIRNALDSVRSVGYIPVLAHVERYECMLRDRHRTEELKNMGTEIQINAAGASGKLGRRTQKFIFGLIKSGLVDYVGTDAHNAGRRAPEFKECYRMLCRKFDASYIDRIFYGNALEIIDEG